MEGNDGKNELTIFVVRARLLMDFYHDELYTHISRSINFYAHAMMNNFSYGSIAQED